MKRYSFPCEFHVILHTHDENDPYKEVSIFMTDGYWELDFPLDIREMRKREMAHFLNVLKEYPRVNTTALVTGRDSFIVLPLTSTGDPVIQFVNGKMRFTFPVCKEIVSVLLQLSRLYNL